MSSYEKISERTRTKVYINCMVLVVCVLVCMYVQSKILQSAIGHFPSILCTLCVCAVLSTAFENCPDILKVVLEFVQNWEFLS